MSSGKPDFSGVTTREIPAGGMCLSSFVVINETGRKENVLLGHLNPKAPWDHIGALDPERIAVHSKGWMIPSSHLILKESPQDSANRILKEQLELDGVSLSGPKVVSEVYTPRRFPDIPSHWDIEFIFTGELPRESLPRPGAWTEMRFVDTRATKRAEMARAHEEVLESLGFRFSDSASL
ncbi:MAG TPA: hypothetical protein VEJ36_04280 [Nitrososphaerales archaeon]|nr:hypothetical protein [Nitrososphaerales archaeon]